MPVSTDAARRTFNAEHLATLAQHGAAREADHDAIVLGQRDRGEGLLLLRFAIELPERATVQRALLLLDPLPRCDRRQGRVSLELAHVLESWRPSTVSSGRRPRLGLPMRAGELFVMPAKAMRLDVTEVVRSWQREPQRYHGVALIHRGDSPSGACFSNGIRWGEPPRLQVFLAPDGEGGDGGGGGAGGGADAEEPAKEQPES
jgi:hypothetical protein